MMLTPQRCPFRKLPAKPGYGERRIARETAAAPLLAQLPDWVKTAEEYEADRERADDEWIRRHRRAWATSWRIVLRWRATTGDDERVMFIRRWPALPHTPEYALDLIRKIDPLGLEDVRRDIEVLG